MDAKIPHATRAAVKAVIEEARRRAKIIDGIDRALTLRLRELGGLIRTAGDIAIIDRAEYIDAKHIKAALKRCKTIEEQIKSKYGSYYAGLSSDITASQKEGSPLYYWNVHGYEYDSKRSYL
jgi:ATP-dependent Lon protease